MSLSSSPCQAFLLPLPSPGVLLESEENHCLTPLVALRGIHQSLLKEVTKTSQGNPYSEHIRESICLLRGVGSSPFDFWPMRQRTERTTCEKKSRETIYNWVL